MKSKKMIHVLTQAGNGGKGCESYLRRKDKKNVPNGGDGGNGGSIIFKASHNAPHIERLKLRQHIVAEHGTQGGSDRKRGKRGKDVIVLVPPGTRIFNRETGLSIRDLAKDGDEVIVARGGAGGLGNDGGKKHSEGKPGEKLEINIEHLIVADIFLLGFPNSGKSEFMLRFTESGVKATEYPFSTKRASIGVHDYDAYKQLVLCELPSIYEGSSEDHGLGVDFLKHLKRAHYILFFLDAKSDFSNSLLEQWQVIESIAADQSVKLFSKSGLIVVNKTDLAEETELQKQVEELRANVSYEVAAISLKSGEHVDELMSDVKLKVESIIEEFEAFQ